jgi:hypothetical protein
MSRTFVAPDTVDDPHKRTTVPASALARIETLAILAALPATAHLTPQEGALYLGTTPEVLRTWRSTGRGPRFKGRGHFVRYTKADLDTFMSAFDHRFTSPAANPEQA